MPLIQIEDESRLKRALGILFYESRGTFQMYPDGKLFVGERQLEALRAAGVVDDNGKPRTESENGAKKTN